MSIILFFHRCSPLLARATGMLSVVALAATTHAGAARAADAATKAAAPRTAAQWQRAAIDDIEQGYRITLENHPGTFDPANPAFVSNLEIAKTQRSGTGSGTGSLPRSGTGSLPTFGHSLSLGHGVAADIRTQPQPSNGGTGSTGYGVLADI